MCLASGIGVTMTIGTVKFYNSGKGFGFVAPEGGGNDSQSDAKGAKAVNLKAA